MPAAYAILERFSGLWLARPRRERDWLRFGAGVEHTCDRDPSLSMIPGGGHFRYSNAVPQATARQAWLSGQ
jgi:hypothetical protein